MRIDLADTLVALVGALPEPDGTVTVSSLEVSLPVEVTAGMTSDGLRVWAHPPHTRWRSGFLPKVHNVRLLVVAEDAEAVA